MSETIYKKLALIIEDNPSDVMIARFMLEENDLIGIHASDGLEALEMLEKYTFSMIILDLQMPNMSGIEFLKRLKFNEKYKNVPVIVTSSKKQEHEIKAVLSFGIQDYLIKPVDPIIYKDKITNQVGKSKADWYEYQFDPKTEMSKATMVQAIQILSMNEMGCVVQTPHAMNLGETFYLTTKVFEDLSQKNILLRVVNCERKSENSNAHIVTTLFVVLKEEDKQKIRVICRSVWLSQKQKATYA